MPSDAVHQETRLWPLSQSRHKGKVTPHYLYKVSKLNYVFLIFPPIVSTLLELTINFSMADDFFPRCEMAKYF